MTVLDELAPLYVGSHSLVLSLADPLTTPRAFATVGIDVDYSGAGDEGVRVPLEMLVVGPSASSFDRHIFRRVAPNSISFRPEEGGAFQVTLREIGHNKRIGKLQIAVDGDQTNLGALS